MSSSQADVCFLAFGHSFPIVFSFIVCFRPLALLYRTVDRSFRSYPVNCFSVVSSEFRRVSSHLPSRSMFLPPLHCLFSVMSGNIWRNVVFYRTSRTSFLSRDSQVVWTSWVPRFCYSLFSLIFFCSGLFVLWCALFFLLYMSNCFLFRFV